MDGSLDKIMDEQKHIWMNVQIDGGWLDRQNEEASDRVDRWVDVKELDC